jgi:hypothetical protein
LLPGAVIVLMTQQWRQRTEIFALSLSCYF